MKSIRGRITIWMLTGLALLWLAGGTAIYLTSRAAMLAQIDTEIQGLSRQVRAQSRGPGGGRGRRHEDAGPVHSAVFPEHTYYQVWNLDGEVLLRSEELGGQDLPRLDASAELAAFATVELRPGTRVRLAATHFAAGRAGAGGRREGRGQGGMNEPVLVAVARSLEEFEAESRKLAWGLGLIGLLAAAGAWLLLSLALRHGLRPLRQLGEAVATVDASSLDVRFGNTDMPRELRPICARLDGVMDRLQQSFERERRFSADLAHELRTPIAELQVMTELSLKWPEERTEQQIHDIRGIATRMRGVVDTLLQLASLEGEGTESLQDSVVLADLIREAWLPCAGLAAKRDLEVRIEWPEDGSMPGNPELWRHVLGNLLANAAEYATAGGRIIVEAGEHSLRVLNTAEGLHPDQVGRMFERFWRADSSRTGAVHCGLGLSLASACAEAMGLHLTATLRQGPNEAPELVMELGDRGA